MVQNELADVDVSDFVVSKRDIVVFECLLSEALSVIAVLFKDTAYRSLNVKFAGYNAESLPLVRIEVEFAVSV